MSRTTFNKIRLAAPGATLASRLQLADRWLLTTNHREGLHENSKLVSQNFFLPLETFFVRGVLTGSGDWVIQTGGSRVGGRTGSSAGKAPKIGDSACEKKPS